MIKRISAISVALIIALTFILQPLQASAVVVSGAVIGLEVVFGMFMGSLMNQMTGGHGYDFTDAFRDIYEFVAVDVDGYGNTLIEEFQIGINTTKHEFNNFISSKFEAYYSDGVAIAGTDITYSQLCCSTFNVMHSKIASGEITLFWDEATSSIKISTADICKSISDIYADLGYDVNGSNRVYKMFEIIDPNVYSYVSGWDITTQAHLDCIYSAYGVVSGRNCFAVPYFIADDKLHIYTCSLFPGGNSVSYCEKNSAQASYRHVLYSLSINGSGWSWSDSYSSVEKYYLDFVSTFSFDGSTFSASSFNPLVAGTSASGSASVGSSFLVTYTGTVVTDFDKIDSKGFAFVPYSSIADFDKSAKDGVINYSSNDVSAPLTNVESTIKDMELEGIDAYATPGTVTYDSVDDELTVTNDTTQEATKVVEQLSFADIDLPDSNLIIDKFPFSLPFDFYRILTIFVYPEEKPVFVFPIKTTITNGGLNYEVDEELVVDLTQFEFMGVDIVRLVLRSGFYIGFVLMLIHITPKLIKH